MQTKSRPIELLSPAKDLNCGIEAINHGADGLHFRVIQPQHIHELGYGFNQLIGIAVFLGGYRRSVGDYFRALDDPHLDGGASEVNADGGNG